MARRSWRDLESPTTTNDHPAVPFGPQMPGVFPAGAAGSQGGTEDLAAAAQLAPNGALGQLLERRNELEAKLRQVTGEEGGDAATRARFPVATFAERRAQEQAWAAQHSANRQRRVAAQTEGGLGPSPLEGRMDAGLAGRSGLMGGIGSRFSSGLGRTRTALDAGSEALRPLTDTLGSVQRSVSDARSQLRDIDRKLASEGASEADRSEVRKALKGDKLDKADGVLSRANSAMDAPKRAADRIGAGWQARQQNVSGAMDRYSGYADRREQRMSLERGGSGDLFERMHANRERALERRRQAQLQDDRDEERRQRALDNRRERQREKAED